MKDGLGRRGLFNESVALSMPLEFGAELSALAGTPAFESPRHALNVVCVGAHPDDPESGCGGTLARYAEAGHAVTIIYLTRGERGIRDKSLEQSARIRSAECARACKIIGAKPVFFGQIDGATEVNQNQVELMRAKLAELDPDLIFAHWPIDTHMDHQVASFLTIRACMALAKPPQLYFFEVNSGSQTLGFCPNTYVDVSATLAKKTASLVAHVSQDGAGIWREHHQPIASWRGRELGVAAAEAFVHLPREATTLLPGSTSKPSCLSAARPAVVRFETAATNGHE